MALGNAGKLAAVEGLIKIAADAGCSLTHLAAAFVIGHPGVTLAIIGPHDGAAHCVVCIELDVHDGGVRLGEEA